MLARLTADQRDDRCRQADDDDYGGSVKTAVPLLAISGPKFIKFWDVRQDKRLLKLWRPRSWIGKT